MSKDTKTASKPKTPKAKSKPNKNIKISTPEDDNPVLTSQLAKKRTNNRRNTIVFAIILLFVAVAGSVTGLLFMLSQKKAPAEPETDIVPTEPEQPKIYSKLSGLEISEESINNSPAFCIQIPNGNDGARPQTGLNSAAVVFEAIAEAGITRFAAIYQNPTDTVIGPIRSVRQYYLDWDTPFDCTVVHAGGSPEALASLRTGKWNHMTETPSYMWRDKVSYYGPNNLMVSGSNLIKFANSQKITASSPKAFPRLSEAESDQIAQTNDEQTEGKVHEFSINFGSSATFNTTYKYDFNTNSYLRSYATGTAHMTYTCDKDVTKENPTPEKDCGDAKQVNPSAVVAIEVTQRLDSDSYHNKITTIGKGTAYIFQNGTAVEGTWQKDSQADQIIFKDSNGEEIKFTPGLLWISAIPNTSGSVKY